MLNDEQRELVLNNMRLVYKIASDRGLLKDKDAVQCGFIGLCKAAEGFDPTRNVRFSTYATIYINRWLNGFSSDIRYRRRIRDGSYIIVDDISKYMNELSPSSNDYDTKLFIQDMMSKVDECSRKILEMIYKGYKQKQIVVELNISSKKYYNRIKKIREKFNYERSNWRSKRRN